MRYFTNPQEVKAIQVESSHRFPTSDGDRTAEPGDWLIHFGKTVKVVKEAEFSASFKTADEISVLMARLARPARAGVPRRSNLYGRVTAVLSGGKMTTRQITDALDDVNAGTLRNLLRKGATLGLWRNSAGYWSLNEAGSPK